MTIISRAMELAWTGLTLAEQKELESLLKKLFTGFVLALVTLGGFGGYLAVVGLHSAGTNPPGTGNTVTVAPAEGVKSFTVIDFCNDPLTKVTILPAPDASGTTYQLTRVRDGRSESVVVVENPAHEVNFATHYFDATNATTGKAEQQSEPAVVDGAGKSCIEKNK